MERAKGFSPSVIVSMDEGGEFFYETYVNGARKRVALFPGTELAQLRAEMQDQRQREALRVEREREAERKAAESVHRRVFTVTVENHGFRFAQRTIGGKVPRGIKSAAKRIALMDLSALE